MDNQNIMNSVGFVKVSPYRTKAIKYIADGMRMPSEIGKHLNIRTSQASNILKDLKEQDLVVCINEDLRKGRLYKLTDLGHQVLAHLD